MIAEPIIELLSYWPEFAGALLQGALLTLPVIAVMLAVWVIAWLGERAIDWLDRRDQHTRMRTADPRQIERDVERIWQECDASTLHVAPPPARPHVKAGSVVLSRRRAGHHVPEEQSERRPSP